MDKLNEDEIMIESFDEPAIMSPNSKMANETTPIESLID
jgi:hypothetical protein